MVDQVDLGRGHSPSSLLGLSNGTIVTAEAQSYNENFPDEYVPPRVYRYGSDGQRIGEPIDLPLSSLTASTWPRLTAAANGSFIATWTDEAPRTCRVVHSIHTLPTSVVFRAEKSHLLHLGMPWSRYLPVGSCPRAAHPQRF